MVVLHLLNKIGFLFVFCVLLLLSGVARGAVPPIPDGYVKVQSGFCNIAVPGVNRNVVEELAPRCGSVVERIFDQLDLENEEGAGPVSIEVRIVTDPAEMDLLAPVDLRPPSWSGAVAYPELGLIILALRHRDGAPVEDLPIVLEHEISHLAMRENLGSVRVPRWFSEGVAIMQSEGSSMARGSALGWASFGGSLLSLDEIERYPAREGKVGMAYAQAADFVGFMLQKKGWHGIRVVLHRLRQGDPFEDAFEAAYDDSLASMEEEWREGLEGNWSWLALVTGTGALWGAITFLFITAFFTVRRRRRERLAEMEEEEAPVERLISVVERLERTVGDSRGRGDNPQVPTTSDTAKVVIEVDGEIHTLH